MKTMRGCVAGLVLSGLVILCAAEGAEVALPGVFSDHMVLQRDLPVPVWGTAAPGASVTVKFRGQEKTVTADKDGKWLTKLDPLKAGGPERLTVSGTNTVTIEDVLVGEVWIGSGQSNMAFGMGKFARGDEVLAAELAGAPYPSLRLLHGGEKGRWLEATPANSGGFSAILYSFGLRLHKELAVPVGLIVGAVPGTPSGLWLSDEAFKADPACQELVKNVSATYEQAQKKYEGDLATWEKAAAEAKAQRQREPRRPSPPAKPGEIRGGKLGGLYQAYIRPQIPYGIRGVLWDQGESGTAVGGVDQYTLMGALIGGWRREWGQGDFPFIYIQKPSGGGCAFDPANPVTSKGEPFEPLPAGPPRLDGAGVEVHVRIMNHPNTGMAISSDLGSGLHPACKSGYGHRAADVALGMVYGRKIEYYGPVYTSHQVEGDKIRVKFTHVGLGLAFSHGEKLQGFAIAGEDKVFQWADAVIDGETVVVSSDKAPKPVAVRYAWSNNRKWANFFNKDGLPALTFRTDAW